MKEDINELSIIDQEKCRWDYENAITYHNLQGAPSMKLWPKPLKFVLDGTEHIVCMNGFRLEGGFHLGSCEHIYHPMYLISLM
jgi:hypothetical protein